MENNIKMDQQDVGCGALEWFGLAQEMFEHSN
jgi:hypothetical protein